MTGTQKLDALDKLIAAVEAGDLGDVNRVLGQMFAADHSLPWEWISNANSAFNGSLDAAVALHNVLLPEPVPSLIYSNARLELLRILKAYRAQVAG